MPIPEGPVTAPQILNTGKGAVTEIAYSPDGTHLVTAHSTGYVCLWFWDQEQFGGSDTPCVNGHTGGVNSISWNPLDTELATVGADGFLRIWQVTNTNTLAERKALEQGGQVMEHVRWSPKGSTIVTRSRDRIWYWNPATGEFIHPETFVNQLISFEWSPSGDELIAIGQDGGIKYVNASSHVVTEFEQLVQGSRGIDIDWKNSGISVISSDNSRDNRDRVRFYASGQSEYVTLTQNETGLLLNRVSPAFDLVAVANRHNIRIFETKAPYRLLQTIELNASIDQMVWSPNGKALAVTDTFGTVTIQPVVQELPIRLVANANQPLVNWSINRFALNEDASKLAVLEANGQISLWKIVEGKFEPVDANNQYPEMASALAWNPRISSIIGVGGKTPRAMLWKEDADTGTLTEETQLSNLGTTTTAMEFSPDGIYVAIGDETQGRVWIYDWQVNAAHKIIQIADIFATISDLAWTQTNDALLLAAVGQNGRLRVWSIRQSGWDPVFLRQPNVNASMNSLAWSPFADKRLVTGGHDMQRGKYVVAVWDIQNRQEFGYRDAFILLGHDAPIISVSWSKGGWIASLDTAGHIVIWDGKNGTRLATASVADANQLEWGGIGSNQRLYISTNTGQMHVYDFIP